MVWTAWSENSTYSHFTKLQIITRQKFGTVSYYCKKNRPLPLPPPPPLFFCPCIPPSCLLSYPFLPLFTDVPHIYTSRLKSELYIATKEFPQCSAATKINSTFIYFTPEFKLCNNRQKSFYSPAVLPRYVFSLFFSPFRAPFILWGTQQNSLNTTHKVCQNCSKFCLQQVHSPCMLHFNVDS